MAAESRTAGDGAGGSRWAKRYAALPREGLTRRQELLRKTIHLATVGVPILVWFLEDPIALALLGSAATLALLTEAARFRLPWARYQFLRRTRRLLRIHERRGLAGATYMAIAYLLAFLLFPKSIAVLAMLYGAIGDAAAALVGKRWGHTQTPWGKTYEGFAAGLVVCLALGIIVPGVPIGAAMAGGLAAATFEFLPLPLDDNLRVTLGGGAAAWALATALASFG